MAAKARSLRESEALLQLIAQRGFARGKKLLPELRRLVLRWRKPKRR